MREEGDEFAQDVEERDVDGFYAPTLAPREERWQNIQPKLDIIRQKVERNYEASLYVDGVFDLILEELEHPKYEAQGRISNERLKPYYERMSSPSKRLRITPSENEFAQ